jgi:hypothetical protein
VATGNRLQWAVRHVGMVLSFFAMAGCGDVSGAAKDRRVDLTTARTWLLPEEVRTGRALTLASISDLYIRTPRRCVIAIYNPNEPPLDADLVELAALMNGAEVNGERIDPLANIGGVLANLEKTYTLPSGTPFWRLITYQSFRCRAELGKPVHPDSVKTWPERINVHLNATSIVPPISSTWGRGLKTQIWSINDNGRPYCRVALAVEGNLIVKVRIDVQGHTQEIPRYKDYRAMDCIMRGVIASAGFTGILRYDLREIYDENDLAPASLADGLYTNKLLDGFEAFQESVWITGGKI